MIGKVARNKLMEDFSQALQKANLATESEISQYRKEAFVVEADEETIDKWEKFMELEYKPDYSLQDRIDRVLYTLQARGSFTKEFLKNQGRLFLNGELEVEELFSQYNFIIRFTSIVGVPENIENFKDMVDLNKPAHLTYEFKFRYNTHGQLEILTHGEMEAYTHDELYQKRVFDDSQLPTTQNFLMKAVNTVKNAVEALIYPLKTDYYNVDIFNDNFRYLDEHKLEKGTYTGNAKNLNDEISKIASITQFGRIKVGTNLRIDENGFLHGNPAVDISSKLDKGDVAEKYNTAEKIGIELDKKQNSSDSGLKTNAKTVVGAINENYEKFKNFCPYSVGDIYITTFSNNPATKYLGTTWEKIECKFLLATSGSNASGQTGGSNTKTISKANLPNVKLQVDSFSLTTILSRFTNANSKAGTNTNGSVTIPENGKSGELCTGASTGGAWFTSFTNTTYNKSSTSASPYTSSLGSGTPLDITPAYYTVHIWKRLS